MDSKAPPPYDMADRHLLRRHLGAFATGVTVVTVGGSLIHGMTANAFTSVSLEPPLLLVCIDRSAVMHEALVNTGSFGVSVLSAHQEEIARHFADRSRPLGPQQFECVRWTAGPRTGAPLITGALAQFECRLWRVHDGGDHTIFIGNLLSMERRPGADALLFVNGQFHRILERTDATR